MAAGRPKGSKIEKSKDLKKIKCSNCKKELAQSNFYSSNSPMFPEGRVNICKNCIQRIIDYTNMESIYQVLRTLDIPFYYDAWESMKQKNPKNPFGNYIRMANSGLNDFAGARWKDSIFESKKIKNDDINTRTENKDVISLDSNELDRLKDKFGEGYLDNEYRLFEKKYQELRPSFQLLTTMHEECLREYCIDKVKEGLAKARGDFKEAKEWAAMAKDVANSGKLNPSQMSKADLSGGLDTFGQLAKMVGQTDIGELLKILPKFIERPKDKPDVTLWHYINYIRDIKGLPECEYKEIYEFYNKRAKEYESKMLDLENPSDKEGDSNG